MGDDNANCIEVTSGYQKWGVSIPSVRLEDLVSVLLPARSGVTAALLGMGMVN